MKVETAQSVGHIPSGLFIVTAIENGEKHGYLASWVQQVSFSPLLVSFTAKAGRPGYDKIMSGEAFAINIVGDHDMQYMKHFWSGYEESPFGEVEHEVTEEGALVIKAAKSAIICKRVSSSKPGDHDVVIAEVVGSYHFNQEAKPKIHLRKSGLDY
jgi:flavin reductase (DIM6/NTAB) family NADH-FMN oxidoreductase RutF